MPTDRAVLALLAANLAVLGAAGAIWLSSRPAATVFIALLSPCCSSVLKGNTPEADLVEGGLGGYLRVGLLCVAGMAGLAAWARSRTVRRDSRLPWQFLLLGAFLVAALASATWSVDPFYTLIKAGSFVMLAFFLLGVLAWSRQPGGLPRILNAVFIFFSVWALANLATVFLWPARAWWWNAPDRFQGLTDHPNSLGGCCMVAYTIFLWQFLRQHGLARLAVGGLLAVAVAMLVMSGSRTSIVGAAAGVLVFLLAVGKRRWALAFTVAALLGLAVLAARPPDSFQRQFGDESAVGLTGRPDIWNASWRLFALRPMTGYGFETQNKLLQDPEYQKVAGVSWTVIANQSTHNGYLSVLLGAGLPAFLVWLAILLLPYVRVWGLAAGPSRAVVLAMMTMSLLTNFVESLITGGSSMPAPVFWIAWALGARLCELAAAHRPEPAAEPEQEAAYAA
ncbi:MAG TPA: O-antigen ligase family protein [Planctomycetota bacterium]|nr:O-antigen ligase family protein [Planctomycetota bacterium]